MNEAVYGLLALILLILGIWKAIELAIRIVRYVRARAERETSVEDLREQIKRKLQKARNSASRKKRSK